MTNEKLPKLTEAQVRSLATDKSFERGKSYYHDGAVSETTRQGMELRGECEGSEYEPYEITVTLDARGVADASCTCPYEYGGICKHIVALLLTYVHRPHAFHTVAPVEEMLKGRSKEDLIAIISAMTEQDRKLLPLIELSATSQDAKTGKPVDTAAIRKRARRALQYDFGDHLSARKMEKELRALGKLADPLLKAKDHLNAGRIYHALLDETVSCYDDIIQQVDEDGNISVAIDEFVESLGECLEKSDADTRTRHAWLETMLDAFAKDIELGGVDFASNAPDIVIREATEEEWKWIEESIHHRASTSREWSREAFVGFLIEGLGHRGRKSEADHVIREVGTPEQQARLLVEEGRIEEAMRIMSNIVKGKPGLVTEFGDMLLRAKAKEAALEFVMTHEAANWKRDPWLAEYYRHHGTPQEAVNAQKTLFINSPSVEQFKSLQKACRKTKDWLEVRAEVLSALERAKRFEALIEIALDEEDVAQALELLPRATGWGATDLRMKVAKAAEKDYPREAIKLYLERVEREIASRTRDSYRTAASYLKKVKPLFISLHGQATWDRHIKALRVEHKNLPALQDELHKAKL